MLRGHLTIRLCFACLAMLLALPGSAVAAIGIESFSLSTSTAQAGTHPDLNADFAFEEPGEPETAKEAAVELPPGYWIYRDEMTRCTASQLAMSNCPISSQVGVATIHGNHEGDPDFELGMAPIYMMPPGNGDLARFGFVIPIVDATVEVPVMLDPSSGYSSLLLFEGLPETMPVKSIEFELWGIPASPVHDAMRFPIIPGGRPSNVPQAPFTRNPTACGSTGVTTLNARSYEDSSSVSSWLAASPTTSDCNKLSFEPLLGLQLSATETSTASGLDLELGSPADLTPQGLSAPDTKALLAAAPAGLQVDEATASIRSACTLAQAHLDDIAPAECPAGSKLGAFAAAVGGIEPLLEGSVYFGGAESPGNYRLFLVTTTADVNLKLPAILAGGAESTEIEIVEIPQIPLEELDIQVDPSTALLVTAPECGVFSTLAEASNWSDPFLASFAEFEFTIDSGPGGTPCPKPGEGKQSGAAPPAATSAPPHKPAVKLLRHPPHRGHDRTPSFRFTSTVAGNTLKCKLDRRQWHPCHSPLTLRRLSPGSHAFRVRAIGPAGEESAATTYRFVVVP